MAVPISNVTRRQVYAPSGAGGAGPYAFTFEILANTDIAVYKDDVLLTLTTHYTVVINANGTGSVTITAAGLALAPASPTQYAIVGNRTISRTTDFTTGGDFFANVLNDELDQQTIFAQQNAEGLQRALQAPQTDPTSINMTLPRASDRANKTLNFDANGNPIAGLTVTANAAANVATWLGTPSSANLRAAMTDETGTGALVFADAPTFSGNPIFSAGTANGVAYLNGSKVLTTGSALVFDGTNLGIGTSSPGAKLDVLGGGSTTVFKAYSSTASIGGIITSFNNTSANYYDADTHTFRFGNGGGPSVVINSSGNLGLGVTPSAGASWVNFQTQRAVLTGGANDRNECSYNSYRTAGQYTYVGTDFATMYQQIGGQHRWHIAPSGTAGNAITFTQAMTLDASGNLGIGNTSPASYNSAADNLVIGTSGSNGMTIVSGSTSSGYIMFADGTTGQQAYEGQITYDHTNNFMAFNTSATERARITSGGDLLVGDTASVDSELLLLKKNTGTKYVERNWNPATTGDNGFVVFGTEAAFTGRGSITYNRAGGLVSFNTTSDYRAKDIIGPVTNPGATIDALKVYEGKMKGATQSRPMLVAHEAQKYAPYAVTGEKDAMNEDGTPKFQQMDVSSLVPLLLAELQSLRARVAQLESKGA